MQSYLIEAKREAIQMCRTSNTLILFHVLISVIQKASHVILAEFKRCLPRYEYGEDTSSTSSPTNPFVHRQQSF